MFMVKKELSSGIEIEKLIEAKLKQLRNYPILWTQEGYNKFSWSHMLIWEVY
jgi:hypothetical protein